MSWIDLRTGRVLWQKEIAIGSIPFQVDEFCVGMISPAPNTPASEEKFIPGQLQLFRLVDGQVLYDEPTQVPQRPSAVFAIVDDSQFYVILSPEIILVGPPPDLRHEPFDRILAGGRLLAFQRETAKALWSRPLENGFYQRTIRQGLPFLMLAPEIRNSTNRPERRILILNRTTGAEIFNKIEDSSFFPLVSPGPSSVDVHLLKQTLRFQPRP